MGAPVSSADGHVTIFSLKDMLCDTDTATLQSLSSLPELPNWLTPVGQGYRYLSSDIDQAQIDTTCTLPGLPDQRSVVFSYLQHDVPRGYEHTLLIYFKRDEEGAQWTPLETHLDQDENMAAAVANGPGLYTLSASIDIPLQGPGWNLIAYPAPDARSIEDALASLDGQYSLVYGYDHAATDSPWRVYDARFRDWLGEQAEVWLDTFEPGKGYWLYLTETGSGPQKLRLRTPDTPVPLTQSTDSAAQLDPGDLGVRTPPALFYGTLTGESFTADQIITASIDNQNCGQGKTFINADELRYAIMVQATEAGQTESCGYPGSPVNFQIGSTSLLPEASWDNSAPQRFDLGE